MTLAVLAMPPFRGIVAKVSAGVQVWILGNQINAELITGCPRAFGLEAVRALTGETYRGIGKSYLVMLQ